MAFFKFRKGADDSKGAQPQPPSLDSIRRRAKYRLLGASVLVLAGVIVFPLVLDSQPRPIAVNTPIDIPDKNKVAPLQLPSASAVRVNPVTGAASITAVASAPMVVAAASGREQILTEPAPTVTESKPKEALDQSAKALDGLKNAASTGAKGLNQAASAADKPASASASDAARARALLEGTSAKPLPIGAASAASAAERPASKAAESRFVVQVGAFAETARAQEVRLRVEHAGLKTYTHVAETKDGRRIRVRVGPFSTRDEAEKAAAKIKTLDLPAAVLTL